MATSLVDPDQDKKKDLNPGQEHYDREFNSMVNAGTMGEDPEDAREAGLQAARDAEHEGATQDQADGGEGGLAKGFGGKKSEDDDDDDNSSDDEATSFPQRLKKTFWGSRRRKQASIAGSLVTLIMGGGIWGAVITSGPLELIHAGQILEHPFSKMESDSSDRNFKFFRYARAWKNRNINYTRVGKLGAVVTNRTLNQLEEGGLKVTKVNSLGVPTEVEITRENVEKSFPETREMSAPEFRNFLAEQLGVPPDKVSLPDKTGKYKMDFKNFKLQDIKAFLKNGIYSLTDNGKIMSGMKARVIGKFFGLGDLFHPFSRALQNKFQDTIDARKAQRESEDEAKKKAAQQSDSENLKEVNTKGDVVAEGVKSEVDKQSGLKSKLIIVAGAVIAAACIAHATADAIPKFDYYRVVAPAEIESASLLAKASQAKAGTGGITSDQVGATVQNFYDDNGQSIFQGAGMVALSGGVVATGDKGGYVNDLPPEDRQAFEQHSTSHIISEASADVLDGLTGPFAFVKFLPGDHHPGLQLCRPSVQYALVAGSFLVRGIADFFSGGGAEVALEATAEAESQVVQYFVVGSAIKWITHWFINSNTAGKLALDAFSGPLGGNLLAFGVRAAANVAAIGSGGVALAGSAAKTIVSDQDRQDQANFEHESMFAKVFDVNDYRSLTGRLADDISPGMFTNFSSMFGNLLNVGGSIFGVFGNLVPHASAATDGSWSGSFNWGFPQYGLPQDMLSDPNLQDPYQNSVDVGTLFENSCTKVDENGKTLRGPQYGACGGDNGYTNRVKSCFGNDLTYDSSSDEWDVVPIANTEINPNDDSYINQHCGNTKDQTWRKIIMYTYDTSTMKDVACFTGDDEQSCKDEGIDSGGSVDSNNDTSSTASATIDMDHLYDSSVSVACAKGTKDIGVQQGYTNGKEVDVRVCAVPGFNQTNSQLSAFGVDGSGGNIVVNSRVSGAVLAMFKAAKKDGVTLSANSSFRTMAYQQSLCPCDGVTKAHPGYSNHQMGLAIDFAQTPGATSIVHGDTWFTWLTKNASTFGYKNYPAESWHWSPTGN